MGSSETNQSIVWIKKRNRELTKKKKFMNRLVDVGTDMDLKCMNVWWLTKKRVRCCGNQGLVKEECQSWASKGIDIRYEIRDNRNGYKSGALKEGLKHNYAKQCDYVVIFDADFQPEADFLVRAIPFLHHNPDIALVQARWRFGLLSLSFNLFPFPLPS